LGRLIRYADDLVIVCRYESQAERALIVLTEELARLGLRVQPAKTRVVNLKHGEGFDFLGFHLRWVASRNRPGVHFLARWPSRRAMARARDRIRELTARNLIGRPVEAVVGSLNRFLRGWGAYFRHGNSAASFDAIEYFVTERIVLFISNKHQKEDVSIPVGFRWRSHCCSGDLIVRLGCVRHVGLLVLVDALGDLSADGGDKDGHVCAAFDATEAAFGFEHADTDPAPHHLDVPPVLHAIGEGAHDRDHRLDGVGA
jgi:hypothetical protein